LKFKKLNLEGCTYKGLLEIILEMSERFIFFVYATCVKINK
jgi:hypothetical protein